MINTLRAEDNLRLISEKRKRYIWRYPWCQYRKTIKAKDLQLRQEALSRKRKRKKKKN